MAPVVSLPPLGARAAMTAGAMSGANSGPMPAMPMASPTWWAAGQFVPTASMWLIMMIAMMLPSAAPTILLYARAATHGRAPTRPATASFLTGYLVAWAGFSLVAAALQLLLEQGGALSPMLMATHSPWPAALILVAAGLYQLSPVKDVCLRHCRNPAQFLSRHYRPGRLGAARMGVVHGCYCIGCCGILMALLFVGGVMNLAWIALLTLLVAAEKMLPHGRKVALVTGLACVAAGMTIALSVPLR
ncbi:DUF2182 domain-containing protein [Novosphingobium lentum]|uniref:DUF2182 domain-containing protein n=1 Tax=Novosphingobium lentum TaxID=145287 RepID=UPI001FE21A64|nr:DUF2182 domain-containing protein [Novosphingobium lentum]